MKSTMRGVVSLSVFALIFSLVGCSQDDGRKEAPSAEQQWVGSWVWEVNLVMRWVARPTEVRLRYNATTKQLDGTWFEDSVTDAGRWRGKLEEIKLQDSSMLFTVEEIKFLGVTQAPRRRFKLDRTSPGGKTAKLYELANGNWKEQFGMKQSP